MMISTLKKNFERGVIPGMCANCNRNVFEDLALLDDAYAVWAGRCPFCNAINFLDHVGMRGYSSGGMHLVLPTDEEKKRNGLPDDTPTQEVSK